MGWTEEDCRNYAESLRKVIKYDYRPWAKLIVEYLAGSIERPRLAVIAYSSCTAASAAFSG